MSVMCTVATIIVATCYPTPLNLMTSGTLVDDNYDDDCGWRRWSLTTSE